MSRRSVVLASLVSTSLFTLFIASPAQAATSYADTDYVALGDSYSSGVGAPGQTGICFRSSNGYPAQWAAAYHPHSFTNAACFGATTTDVTNYQVSSLSSKTDLITMTIGGNDVGFVPVIATCTIGTYNACKTAVDAAHDYTENKMTDRLDKTYKAIKAKAPNAEVVILGYPLLFDESSADCGVGGMALNKRQILNAADQDLNDLIKERAQAAGFRFADVKGTFADHGVCAQAPWINGLTVVPPTDSYHPTKSGYSYGYVPALVQTLA
jgi:lysophospholipase L1-like esterase